MVETRVLCRIESKGGKWARVSKRQFLHNLVNAHVVAEGYEPRGLVWQLMCERTHDGVTAVKV